MPTYTVKDNASGKVITFNWTGEGTPTDEDMAEIAAEATKSKTATMAAKIKAYFKAYGRPMLELGGMMTGGAIGAAAGAPTGPGAILTGLATAGGGYAIGKKISDIAERGLGRLAGEEVQYPTLGQEAIGTAKDVATGAAMETTGGLIGKAIPPVAKGLGKVISPIWARMMGTGKTLIEEAVKSGTTTGITLNPVKTVGQFDKAMRGELTRDEMVDMAKDALSRIKDKRGQDYVAILDRIKVNPTRLNQIKMDLDNTLNGLIAPDKFDVTYQYGPSGALEFDFSKSTLVESQPVLKRAMSDVLEWTDTTAKGLDILKKRMSTYIDQVKRGTPAEAFLTKLEKNLDSSLKQTVPGYKTMTRGYAEATKLIKDIESTLMLRKEGMMGRVTPDMILRRLMSTMKDNFEFRKDLLDVLGAKGNEQLSQAVAGYVMRSVTPLGISGSIPAIGTTIGLAKFVNPAFWPLLAMSSPRVSGEFLRMFGKFAVEAKGTAPVVGRVGAYVVGQTQQKGAQ